MIDPTQRQVWLIGGGIASMAAAVFMIRDAGVPGPHIHILEETGLEGGSLDGGPSPVQAGFVTRGGRMLEEEAYQTLWDLLQTIPSLDDPDVSVREEILAFNEQVPTEAKARLIGRGARILNAAEYGFDAHDRAEMTRLLAMSEHALGSRRIDELFSPHFFGTNFWQMWRTTFAFQNWHSAVELRRYFLRFIQEFPRLHTLAGVRRTRYNQYDSITVPVQRWLQARGVDLQLATRVTDADFEDDGRERRCTRLHLKRAGGVEVLALGAQDIAMFTLGSITSDARFGSNDRAPDLVRDRQDGGWALWETLARKAPDFGRPTSFCGNVDEHKWMSFTLTMPDDRLLDRITAYSGNAPGTGALMSFVDSPWLMSVVVPFQPHFRDLPPGQRTLWGYGLFVDAPGEVTGKPMAACTGRELLAELMHQLGLDADPAEAARLSEGVDVTTVMMPYASALFACRAAHDRPRVLPERSANFAFLGQFTELPEDVVFTVEYSVHGAMHAVYRLFGVDRPIPPIYHGLSDPRVGLKALAAAFQ